MTININVESHFAKVPSANIQRSILDRSHNHTTTFNVGDVVPILVDEILPGDSIKLDISSVVRLQTLLAPIFTNIFLDTYAFFVPNRIVWDHWKEFLGENNKSAWIDQTSYRVPRISSPEGGFEVGTLADYMGLPVLQPWTASSVAVSALPFRAYAKIVNEFFRDQNLSDPLNIPTGDADQSGSNGSNYINDVANGGKPFIAAKTFDAFTGALPAPQKGVAPKVPIEVNFPSGDYPVYAKSELVNIEGYPPVATRNAGSGWPSSNSESALRGTLLGFYNNYGNQDPSDVYNLYTGSGDANKSPRFSKNSDTGEGFFPLNLWANLPEISAGGQAIDINTLRLAFQTQKFLERQARGGTRYVEVLLSHFGVRSPDASLQRPEYLGGHRTPINIHQVTNQAQTSSDFLGDVGAMSVTSDVSPTIVKSFTEHGYLFVLAVARYKHSYSQGIERFWRRSSMYDFFWPVFSALGEQPVYQSELMFDGNNADTVFGFQEAWYDYRYKQDYCTSLQRPGVPNTLAYWNSADYYSEPPTLSDSWIREDKSNIDRNLAVSSSVSNQLLGDFFFKYLHTRPMPMYSIPGLIDHF